MRETWFRQDVLLAAPIFLVVSGIPLRVVLGSPDAGARGKHREPRSDQGAARSPSSRRSLSSTLWHVRVFCETRQLTTGSQRG